MTVTATTTTGTSNAYYMTVKASEQMPLTFLSIQGSQLGYGRGTSLRGCKCGFCGRMRFYVLDPSMDKAFSMSGGNFSTGCGIHACNSSKSDAVGMSGGNLSLNSGAKLTIQGGLSQSGGNIIPSANVQQNQSSVSNPMSGMTAPTPASSLYL